MAIMPNTERCLHMAILKNLQTTTGALRFSDLEELDPLFTLHFHQYGLVLLLHNIVKRSVAMFVLCSKFCGRHL